MSVLPRLRRLFAADGRCFDVAVDHGFFGEPRFLGGIEDLPAALDALVEAAPDAIQLSPGAARLLQDRPGPKPALVMRTDVANVYGPRVDDEADLLLPPGGRRRSRPRSAWTPPAWWSTCCGSRTGRTCCTPAWRTWPG